MYNSEFEQKCKENNLTPVGRYNRGDVELFVAEGEREPSLHPESMPVAHWTVMWAVCMGEKMDTANFIRIPSYVTVAGIPVKTTQETRLVLAEDAAEEWARANHIAGRF